MVGAWTRTSARSRGKTCIIRNFSVRMGKLNKVLVDRFSQRYLYFPDTPTIDEIYYIGYLRGRKSKNSTVNSFKTNRVCPN